MQTTPTDFGKRIKQNWYVIVNEELTLLHNKIRAASPVYKGDLRDSWTQQKATPLNGQGSLETHSQYFPNIEAGLPKGYVVDSAERDRLIDWVMIKMNVKQREAANQISRDIAEKYRALGRKGKSYIGAAPAAVPSKLGVFPSSPVKGGLIDQAFQRIKDRL